MKTLAESLAAEQSRVRDLVGVYESIQTGAFGAVMLRQALRRAEEAAASGDVVAMMQSYKELRDCQ